MNKTYNRKRMYDYCCQKMICHKEILSRIIQEFVDEAKEMTLEEISKHIYDIKMSSLEEYIHLKGNCKDKQQDICCYFGLKERIEINIYLNLDYIENVQINKRNKHKVYHLYFITRSLEYNDGTVLKDRNYKLNINKVRIYISNRYQVKKEYKQHNEILTLVHIILNYRMKAKYKIRLIKKYIDNKEINRGLEIMCNLSQAIEIDIKERTAKKVTREVIRKNNIRAIYNVMKNINVSLEIAIDILDIPKSERIYLEEYFKK
ncbi:MAG: hypothetical protein Q4Q31_12935 [Bacillota bacterium]|nr:hypothetical protein [Bacillota bacterium]